MGKWTLDKINGHRNDIINVHYCINTAEHGDEVVLAAGSGNVDTLLVSVYPDEIRNYGEMKLNSEQIDHFMHSTEFDKPLFKILVDTLSLHADVALMMSLTHG
jgi:hypothetical protein